MPFLKNGVINQVSLVACKGPSLKSLRNMDLRINCALQVLRLGFKLEGLALRVESEVG